jgi:hypothetical protein
VQRPRSSSFAIANRWPMILRAEDNDSFVLGGQSLSITAPEVRPYAGWLIALDGAPHPRVCVHCGTILQRMPIPPFKLRRRDLDFSITGDGYHVVSQSLLEFMQEHLGVDCFQPVPRHKGFYILDHTRLPVLEVDREKSGTRESAGCGLCGNPYYQLFGRVPGRPPTIQRPFFRKDPEAGKLFRSDMEFGTTHGRAPALVAHADDEVLLQSGGFAGLHVW